MSTQTDQSLLEFLNDVPALWQALVQSGLSDWIKSLTSQEASAIYEQVKDKQPAAVFKLLKQLELNSHTHAALPTPAAHTESGTPNRDKLLHALQAEDRVWKALSIAHKTLEHMAEVPAGELLQQIEGLSGQYLYKVVAAYLNAAGRPQVAHDQEPADDHGQHRTPTVNRQPTHNRWQEQEEDHREDEGPEVETNAPAWLQRILGFRESISDAWEGMGRLQRVVAAAIPVLVIVLLVVGVVFGMGWAKLPWSTTTSPRANPTTAAPRTTQPVAPFALPIPTKAPEAPAQQYQVAQATAADGAVGISGRAGPGESYAVTMPPLEKGLDYTLVPYAPNTNWVIVVFPTSGAAAFYPAGIFTTVGPNRLTGKYDVITSPAVDALFRSLSVGGAGTQSVATSLAKPLSPVAVLLLAILAVAAVVLIPIEASNRHDVDDGIQSLVVTVLSVGVGVFAPVLYDNLELVFVNNLNQLGITLPAAALYELRVSVLQLIGIIASVIMGVHCVLAGFSPILTFDHGKIEWFKHKDANPMFNPLLLHGFLSVLGVITAPALALGIAVREPVLTITGLWTAITSNTVPPFTLLTLGCFAIALFGFVLDELPKSKWKLPLAAVVLIGGYYFGGQWLPFELAAIASLLITVAIMVLIDGFRFRNEGQSVVEGLRQSWAGAVLVAISLAAVMITAVGV